MNSFEQKNYERGIVASVSLLIKRLGWISFIVIAILLATLFFSFRNDDFDRLMFYALNFSLRNPFAYYDNIAASNIVIAGYLPATSFLIAIWYLPLKILQIPYGSAQLLHIYWCKSFFIFLFIISSVLFYKIIMQYKMSSEWSLYSAAGWLSSPIAIFAILIFSQGDILYITFMLWGFLYFLKYNLWKASLVFGLAITFKYQPVFVFIPLLLLYEKRIRLVVTYLSIFVAPAVLWVLVYTNSAASDVKQTMGRAAHIARLFYSSFEIVKGDGSIYMLLFVFFLSCVVCYFINIDDGEQKNKIAAYILFLLPAFSIIFGHFNAYMPIFLCPGLILTSMIDRRYKDYLYLDLIGYVVFIGYCTTIWYRHADDFMFFAYRGWDLGFTPHISPMGNLFIYPIKLLVGRIPDFSIKVVANIYYTCFIAYIVAHIVLKAKMFYGNDQEIIQERRDYRVIRHRFFAAALVFLLPASFSIYQSYKYASKHPTAASSFPAKKRNFGELQSNMTFAQTFQAKGNAIEKIDLYLATYTRKNNCTVVLDVSDANGEVIESRSISADIIKDNSWHSFDMVKALVVAGKQYTIRLTSPNASVRNAITWWAEEDNLYGSGHALVNGVETKNYDFCFMITFGN